MNNVGVKFFSNQQIKEGSVVKRKALAVIKESIQTVAGKVILIVNKVILNTLILISKNAGILVDFRHFHIKIVLVDEFFSQLMRNVRVHRQDDANIITHIC